MKTAFETLTWSTQYTDGKYAIIAPVAWLQELPAALRGRFKTPMQTPAGTGGFGVLYTTNRGTMEGAETFFKRKGYPEAWRESPQYLSASSDTNLRSQIIRLAHAHPELRGDLLPLLTKQAGATSKVAHKPIMPEVTKEAVRLGTALMMYKIDKGANNSKFYEGAIVPDGTGFRIIRRWGRLTDSGATGRIDGAKFDSDPRFRASSLGSAKSVLHKVYETRLEHGYIDAYGDSHTVPATGKKLPMGQYPIGLGGAGFGWGGQSVEKCVPALHVLVQQVDQARDEISSSGQASAVEAALESALTTIQRVSSEDSTMATKLADMITKTLRRVKGGPRFLPDPVGTKLTQELFAIRNYVTKQTSYCA